MATVYSLICFGGRTGKTVTISNGNPCVITLTRHGLRDGTGVVLSTTGTLPAGITAGVTYYARSTGANTHNLYDTSANAIAGGATGRIATTTAGSGTHTIKSAYFMGLTVDQLLRYGSAGSERIYDGISAWSNARASASTANDIDYLEIGMIYTDAIGDAQVVIALPSVEFIIYPINGSGHGGIFGAGYVLSSASSNYASGVLTFNSKGTAKGFTVECTAAGSACSLNYPSSAIDYMILSGSGLGTQTYGLRLYNPVVRGVSCLITGFIRGVDVSQSQKGSKLFNNTITKNSVGLYTAYTSGVYGYYYNNIIVGNTTNYSAQPSGIEGASKNAGLSTDTPWVTSGGSSISMTTADFIDYANNNFKPALFTSPQVDSALDYYGYESYLYDLSGDVRPSYNNGGAVGSDVGCYEFDNGYGLKPATSVTTFKGVKAGSEIRIYNSSQVELAGVESCSADHELSWTIPVGDVYAVIIHPQYKIKEFSFTSTEGANSLPIQQDKDKWFSNP